MAFAAAAAGGKFAMKIKRSGHALVPAREASSATLVEYYSPGHWMAAKAIAAADGPREAIPSGTAGFQRKCRSIQESRLICRSSKPS
jgi:hypothetical protein